jgi:hypothetical protein
MNEPSHTTETFFFLINELKIVVAIVACFSARTTERRREDEGSSVKL